MACEIFEQFDCSNVLQIIWILNYLFILLSEQNTADVYLQQMTAKGCLTPVLCFFPSFVDCRIINLSVLCLPLIFFYRICFSPLIFIFLSTSTSQLSPVLHVLSHSAHFLPALIYPVVLCYFVLLCSVVLSSLLFFPPLLYPYKKFACNITYFNNFLCWRKERLSQLKIGRCRHNTSLYSF